jgi:hypothetical protein
MNYVVRWSTANEDNVANELMRCEINPFGNQNQASHLTYKPVKRELGSSICKTRPDYSVTRIVATFPWLQARVIALQRPRPLTDEDVRWIRRD